MRFTTLIFMFAAFCGAFGSARAQSTDGYSRLQYFPVVVDTASFVQRFTLHNDNADSLTLFPVYYPGAGTSQATPLNCSPFVISAHSERIFTSLRSICPGLPAGSQFGLLFLIENEAFYEVWAGYSRVSNIQGAGFSVEAFPASAFTTSVNTVTGLRRLAATVGAPAFQTNCFVARAPNITSVSTTPTNVHYTLTDSASATIGSGDVSLAPGGFVRLLDIFAAAGAPAGDHDDAMVKFEPGLISFCTVQDNTSFGADFRIAKMSSGLLPGDQSATPSAGAMDWFVPREFKLNQDAMGRAFSIPAGNFNNVHLFSYHAPDSGMCEIINPLTGERAFPEYGLEIRVMNAAGTTILGGDNSVSVPDISKPNDFFFGEKGSAPANGQLLMQVESNGQNGAASRPYYLHCRSGSGLGIPNILRYQQAGTEF